MEVDQLRQPYALAPDEGEGWWVRGNRFTFKASGREVGSGFAVVETLLHPVAAAPAHLHHGTDEAVYVLEGELILEVGERRFKTRPGSFFPPAGHSSSLRAARTWPGARPLGPHPGRLRRLLAGNRRSDLARGSSASSRAARPSADGGTGPKVGDGISTLRTASP
jgi:mannose-6-phosphate isomerase-like protein (cupin superfamily)